MTIHLLTLEIPTSMSVITFVNAITQQHTINNFDDTSTCDNATAMPGITFVNSSTQLHTGNSIDEANRHPDISFDDTAATANTLDDTINGCILILCIPISGKLTGVDRPVTAWCSVFPAIPAIFFYIMYIELCNRHGHRDFQTSLLKSH